MANGACILQMQDERLEVDFLAFGADWTGGGKLRDQSAIPLIPLCIIGACTHTGDTHAKILGERWRGSGQSASYSQRSLGGQRRSRPT